VLKESRAQVEIANRTAAQRSALYIRRSLTIGLSILVMIGGWVAVGLICYYENTLYSLLHKLVPFIDTFLPISLVASISLFETPLLNMLTHLESWDYEHTRVLHAFWRTYIAGALNTIVFALIYSEALLNKSFLTLGKAGSVVTENVYSTTQSRFSGKEDMIATQLLKIVRDTTVLI
jgi:hypothetical protein